MSYLQYSPYRKTDADGGLSTHNVVQVYISRTLARVSGLEQQLTIKIPVFRKILTGRENEGHPW